MLLPKLNAIYIHVRKTGGTSIYVALKSYMVRPKKHPTLKEIYETYPGCESYYKFASMRNSWDWLVSLYHYNRSKGYGPAITFEEFVRTLHDGSFYDMEPRMSPKVFIPQIQYLTDDGSLDQDKISMDYIIQFANLQHNFNVVTQCLNLGSLTLPHRQATPHKPYQTYYNKTTKKMVEDLYAPDIEYAGYTFKGI